MRFKYMTDNHRKVYKTKAWQAVRRTVAMRAGFKCEVCGCPVSLTKKEAIGAIKVMHGDHIKTVRERPDLALDPDNVSCKCEACHDRRTIYDQGVNKGKGKPSGACDESGWPVDKTHGWNS